MEDRVSKYPGRVLVTPENGSAPFYATVTRADEPTQTGDPLNKSTFLKDETAALFGLEGTAVPDDVFEWIGKWGQASWKLLAEYNVAGSYTFIVPEDVNELGVFILGGGGGGGASSKGPNTAAYAQGGASGGLRQIVLKKTRLVILFQVKTSLLLLVLVREGQRLILVIAQTRPLEEQVLSKDMLLERVNKPMQEAILTLVLLSGLKLYSNLITPWDAQLEKVTAIKEGTFLTQMTHTSTVVLVGVCTVITHHHLMLFKQRLEEQREKLEVGAMFKVEMPPPPVMAAELVAIQTPIQPSLPQAAEEELTALCLYTGGRLYEDSTLEKQHCR